MDEYAKWLDTIVADMLKNQLLADRQVATSVYAWHREFGGYELSTQTRPDALFWEAGKAISKTLGYGANLVAVSLGSLQAVGMHKVLRDYVRERVPRIRWPT